MSRTTYKLRHKEDALLDQYRDLNYVEKVETIRENENDFDYGDISVLDYIANATDDNIVKATIDIDGGEDIDYPHNDVLVKNFEFGSEEDNTFYATTNFIARIVRDTINELFLNPDVKTKIKTNWQPELVTEPHLIIHYAYNRRMKKLFCEFTFDYILIKVLKSVNLYNKFVETICNRINANYRIEFSRDYLELMRPKKLAPSNCYVSDMLSINTISIWKSLNGHYEFLNDKAEVDIDKTNYNKSKTFQEYSSDILRFNAEVSRINRNISIGNYDKLRAFELYKEFYNEEFGYPLRQLESARFDNAEETSSGELIMFVDETYFYINILHFTDNLYKDEEEETETE